MHDPVFCVFKFALLQIKMNDTSITLYKGFYRLFCVAMGLLCPALVHRLILPFMGLVCYGMIWALPDISRQTLNRCHIYVNFAYKAFKGAIKRF